MHQAALGGTLVGMPSGRIHFHHRSLGPRLRLEGRVACRLTYAVQHKTTPHAQGLQDGIAKNWRASREGLGVLRVNRGVIITWVPVPSVRHQCGHTVTHCHRYCLSCCTYIQGLTCWSKHEINQSPIASGSTRCGAPSYAEERDTRCSLRYLPPTWQQAACLQSPPCNCQAPTH